MDIKIDNLSTFLLTFLPYHALIWGHLKNGSKKPDDTVKKLILNEKYPFCIHLFDKFDKFKKFDKFSRFKMTKIGIFQPF